MQSEKLQSQTAAPQQPRQRTRPRWRILIRRKPLGAISAVILCGLIATAALAPSLLPTTPTASISTSAACPSAYIHLTPHSFWH